MRARGWRLAVFVFIVGFTLNLVGIVTHVAVSSLAKRLFATPLPGVSPSSGTPMRGASSSSVTF
jgi:hypothetical protein